MFDPYSIHAYLYLREKKVYFYHKTVSLYILNAFIKCNIILKKPFQILNTFNKPHSPRKRKNPPQELFTDL